MSNTPSLTFREKEVLGLLLQGKSNKQIALTLGISSRTVEFHLKNIYTKFQVSSRVELILCLGKSSGNLISAILGYSTVDKTKETTENRGNPASILIGGKPGREILSAQRKAKLMIKRSILYLLFGFLFGAGFWHYFSITAKWTNDLFVKYPLPDPNWQYLMLPLLLAFTFGVWVIPAILPAVYEYRRSASLRFAVTAVVIVWISAVKGYYVNYVIMLAFVGLPNMAHLVITGEYNPTLWQNWALIFPDLILTKFFQWFAVNLALGGLIGILTSTIYARWVSKSQRTSPA